ncbi:MAG TPA: hypothetical protein VIS99_11485 [Terrimicrobiaceae bacterium]
MKALLLSFFLILLIAFGEDSTEQSKTSQGKASEAIKSYDCLGRDNVTIRAQHKGGSSDSDYSYRSRWGSYVRTVTSTKDIEVAITQPRKEKLPLKLEFFFVIKGDSKRYAKQAGIMDLPEGEGTAVFSTSAKQGQERWVFLGVHEKSGERIEGWLVRALNNDRIIGIAASSPSLEELAADPQKLKGLLAAN